MIYTVRLLTLNGRWLGGRLVFKLIYILALIGCCAKIPEPKVRSDREILAAVINSECSSCPITELYLIGSVVINRVYDNRFPNTVGGVVFQAGQFQATQSSHFFSTEKTLFVADHLISGLYRIPDIVYFCTLTCEDMPMNKVTITGKHHLYGL